jgi:hypothetical protein
MGIMEIMGNMGKEAKRIEGESLSSFAVWFRHPTNGCLAEKRLEKITLGGMSSGEEVRRLLDRSGFWRSGAVPACDNCQTRYKLYSDDQGPVIEKIEIEEEIVGGEVVNKVAV